jgi:hypothetical protein
MAAARPGPSAGDARVPCPLCGGLIHPIAGKCKHCKAELAAYRAVRPAANAPLPPLHHAVPTAGNGLPASAPIAHAVAMPLAAQTVLPPRPAPRAHTASPRPVWRSWPVVVIVLAMMAIVAAVVLMVWPTARPHDGKHVLQPPPAPERMDTQTPPVEPRAAPHASAPRDPAPTQPDPAPTQPADPRPADPGTSGQSAQSPSSGAQPDPGASADADADDADVFDPFGGAQGGPNRGHRALAFNGSMLSLAIAARLCRKLVQCGTSDATIKTTCDALGHQPLDAPANCPAAERCLRHVDALGCTSQPDALQAWMLLMRFRDCIDAARC